MYILPQKPVIDGEFINRKCFPLLTFFMLEWNGSLFVRSGSFQGAVFKFTIEFPINYPQESPDVVFQTFATHKIWHPQIDEMMGFLDIGKENKVNSILEYINSIFSSDNFKV